MRRGFAGVPWVIWGIGALAVAAVFVFVVPSADQVEAARGLSFVVLRWFHSLCWVLLALNFFVRAVGKAGLNRVANLLAAGGGIAYAIYMIAFVKASGG